MTKSPNDAFLRTDPRR